MQGQESCIDRFSAGVLGYSLDGAVAFHPDDSGGRAALPFLIDRSLAKACRSREAAKTETPRRLRATRLGLVRVFAIRIIAHDARRYASHIRETGIVIGYWMLTLPVFAAWHARFEHQERVLQEPPGEPG